MTQIDPSPDLPSEVWDIVGPLLEAHRRLLPTWLHVLNVYWCDTNTDPAASMTVDEEYRRADLYIHPNFISRPDKRVVNIRHELLHLYTEYLTSQLRRLIGTLPEGHARETESEQIRLNVERVTCDLTYMVSRILDEASA